MIDVLIRGFVRSLLWFRYRITVNGLEELSPKDDRGILILPNHPGLIDPIILLATVTRRFRAGVLADRAQVERPLIRTLVKRDLGQSHIGSRKGSRRQGSNRAIGGGGGCGTKPGPAFRALPCGAHLSSEVGRLGRQQCGRNATARLPERARRIGADSGALGEWF